MFAKKESLYDRINRRPDYEKGCGLFGALFHSIHALLFVSGDHVKTHVGAHNRFRELYIRTGLMDISLSIRLQRTSEKGQFSDYDYDEITESEASESVQDATFFFDSVVRYLKENNHLQ